MKENQKDSGAIHREPPPIIEHQGSRVHNFHIDSFYQEFSIQFQNAL
jgi:hypothetical protein